MVFPYEKSQGPHRNGFAHAFRYFAEHGIAPEIGAVCPFYGMCICLKGWKKQDFLYGSGVFLRLLKYFFQGSLIPYDVDIFGNGRHLGGIDPKSIFIGYIQRRRTGACVLQLKLQRYTAGCFGFGHRKNRFRQCRKPPGDFSCRNGFFVKYSVSARGTIAFGRKRKGQFRLLKRGRAIIGNQEFAGNQAFTLYRVILEGCHYDCGSAKLVPAFPAYDSLIFHKCI